MHTECTVGFIGLGTMGLPMAVSIVRAGHRLVAYDIRSEPLAELASLGATSRPSADELAAECDVILITLVDDGQVERAMLGGATKSRRDGTDGVIACAKPGTVIVLHSTLLPATCRRLADLAETQGVCVIDAPISGGPAAAVSGNLTFMVGGSVEALGRCRPILEAMGSQIFHMGPTGMGQIAKLTNNIAFAVTMQGVNEALRFAKSSGIDGSTMLDVLAACTADSWTVRNWAAIGETARTYPMGSVGLANLTYKDLAIAMSVAHESHTSIPVTSLTSQLVEEPYNRGSPST